MSGISLEGVREGAILHALRENGARTTCLVTSVNDVVVFARVITIQLELVFDVSTGIGNSKNEDYACKVVSAQKLPKEVYEALLSVDRKYRLRNAPEGSRLLSNEIEAFIYIDKSCYSGEASFQPTQDQLLQRFLRPGYNGDES